MIFHWYHTKSIATTKFANFRLRCQIPETSLERISHFITKTNIDDTVSAPVTCSSLTRLKFPTNIKNQVLLYMKDSSSISTSPIYYWAEYSTSWPDLSKLALKYLKVPLSVVQLDADVFKSPAICCVSNDTEAYAQDVVLLRENLMRHSNLTTPIVQ